jgi:hypothetical protein
MVAVRALRLKSLLLTRNDPKLVHESQRSITAAVHLFLFEMRMDGPMPVPPFGFVMDSQDHLLDHLIRELAF